MLRHDQPVPGHSEFPDDIARSEHDGVATAFLPETGIRLRRAAALVAVTLAAAFIVVVAVRLVHSHRIATAAALAASTPPPVDVVVARSAVTGQSLTLPGQTAAWYEATIYARVSGYVARWLVDIGDHVQQGQVLAVIETPELDAELGAARAQLKASEAQVIARQAEVEFARTTNERWRDSPKGVVSEQERDAKRADFETAEARLYAARAQVALDQSRVEQYGALARFKNVTAPFTGVITERHIDVGNLVTAGSTSATTPLYHLIQSDPLRVYVDVPQSMAADLLKPGQPADVIATDGSGARATGKTVRASGAINAQARTMRVEVDLPNGDGKWVPGMYTTVAFRLSAHGVVEVPAAALAFRASGLQVARVGAGDRVTFVPVVIARDNGSLVELASGVSPGDRLILNVNSRVIDGSQVSVSTSADSVVAPSRPAAPRPAGR